MMITQEYLKSAVTYDPENGEMVWKNRPKQHFKSNRSSMSWNTRYAGKRAVTLDGKGYRVINIDAKRYIVHRLAWLYIHGEWPNIIDHINGVKTDNRLVNLRNVNTQQNHLNMRRSSKNSSGVTGVYLNAKKRIWCAQMKFNGRAYHLGSSKVFDEAVAMRKAEEKRLGFSERHGECANA